jgi:hypothetical protein
MDGVMRDPAHAAGISIDEWLKSFAELNKVPLNNVLDFWRFTPILGKTKNSFPRTKM